jgi:excisionase family DNA binding protein
MSLATPQAVDASRLMNKTDAAAYLGLSEAFVLRLARQGRVRSYRIGRFVKFDPRDLDAYAASCARH